MVIRIQCKDQVGLVGNILTVRASQDINIVSMKEHVDTIENHLFIPIDTQSVGDFSMIERQLKAVLLSEASIKINPKAEKR